MTQESNKSNADALRRAEIMEHYGQVRTMADVLISMNEQQHFSNSRDAANAVCVYICEQNRNHAAISGKAFQFIVSILLRQNMEAD